MTLCKVLELDVINSQLTPNLIFLLSQSVDVAISNLKQSPQLNEGKQVETESRQLNREKTEMMQ